MRETIPLFGIQPPFLGVKNSLVSPFNYLGKASQTLLIKNKYLNQSKFKLKFLLNSQLSSETVQRSLDWNHEFDSLELPSEYLQANESHHQLERTKAEFQELSPTKVYVVEDLPLDSTANKTPIQTSTKRKTTRKTTKAKSKTKSSTRKTTSKKTVPDVRKQDPLIASHPQRRNRQQPKIDFLLEQQRVGENTISLAAETTNLTSKQNPQIYSSKDLPFQPTALEQPITPVEKETQFAIAAEPVNTETSPATIATPIQLAPIPESHPELRGIISSSTQKQSDRQLATAEQIVHQTIASSDRTFEPQENSPSQPTRDVKSKAAQLQRSTVQKTGIPLNQDLETTATAISPTSPLPYSSPNLEKRLHLPLEQRLKQVEGEELPVAEIESNIISNQQLIESHIVPGNLAVTNSSTVEPRDRSFEPEDNSPSQTQQLNTSATPGNISSLQQPIAQPPTTALRFPIPEASQEIQPASTIPILSDTPVQPLLHAAVDSQQLPSFPDAAPEQIVASSGSNEPEDDFPSQTQALDTEVTPENVSSVQQPVVESPTTPLPFTTDSVKTLVSADSDNVVESPTTPLPFTIPEASQEIQPASTIPILPDTPVQPLLHAAVDSQQLPSFPDAAPEQIVASSGSNEPEDDFPSQTQLDTSVTPENVSSVQQPVAQPLALDALTTTSEAKQIYPTSIDKTDEEESSAVEIKRNTISNHQLTESELIPSQEDTSSSTIEPRDRDSQFPQESTIPSVEPRRHVSAPDLPVKQSRNLQRQDRFEAQFSSQRIHPIAETEPADPIASANSQQPPIQEALLERTTGDRETPTQPEPANETLATSLEQSVTPAETESVFPAQIPPQGFAVGGAVPAASNLSRKPIAASDTVPAMLTPGEFVVNATDAQKHLDILHHINKGGAVEILPETPTKVESSDAAKDPQTAPSSVQRKISHTSLPRVVKALIPPTIQLAEEPAAKNRVTQTDPPQSHYAATELIYRKPAPTSSAPPDSIPDRWDSVEDLLFGGTADNSYTSDSMAVPRSYSNRNVTPSNPGTSETIVSSVQPQGFAKGGAVAPDTFTPEKAIAHTIEAPASCCQKQANWNDLEMLAREIYHRLRQRLELERERHGFYSGRLPW